MDLKDSGARRSFESGAVRDITEGKGRCDLLPLGPVSVLMMHIHAPDVVVCALKDIQLFCEKMDSAYLHNAIQTFCESVWGDTYSGLLQVSIHYEDGARKYAERNWERGIPLHSFIDSGVRHLLKYARGDDDEPHDRAFVWNMLCAIYTFEKYPDLRDIQIPNSESEKRKLQESAVTSQTSSIDSSSVTRPLNSGNTTVTYH